MAVMVTQAALAADVSAGGFRDRVKISMMASAVVVQNEAVGAFSNSVYQKRQTLATAVLSAPLAFVERFALAAASHSTIGADVGNCCAANGCIDGSCAAVLAAAGGKTRDALVKHVEATVRRLDKERG